MAPARPVNPLAMRKASWASNPAGAGIALVNAGGRRLPALDTGAASCRRSWRREAVVARAFRVVWIALLVASPGFAQELYVPAAAHTSGAAGTVWRTDLEVKARGGEVASFTVELLEERTANTDPLSAAFSLEAGESLRLVDVVDTAFGFYGSGALRLTAADGGILATSRTYNTKPERDLRPVHPGDRCRGRGQARPRLRAPAAIELRVVPHERRLRECDRRAARARSRPVRLLRRPARIGPGHAAALRDAPDPGGVHASDQRARRRRLCRRPHLNRGRTLLRLRLGGGQPLGRCDLHPGAARRAARPPVEPRFVVFEAFMRPG